MDEGRGKLDKGVRAGLGVFVPRGNDVALPARTLAPVPAEHRIPGSSGPVPGLGGGALLPTPSFSVSVEQERVDTSLSIGVSFPDLGSGTGTSSALLSCGHQGSKGCPGVAYFQSYLLRGWFLKFHPTAGYGYVGQWIAHASSFTWRK